MGKKDASKSGDNINTRLALVMKSGKAFLGYSQTLKSLRKGKSKLVIIANNCPPLRKSEIEYYAMLAKTGVHHYAGSAFFTVCPLLAFFIPPRKKKAHTSRFVRCCPSFWMDMYSFACCILRVCCRQH
eukprot:TRINITY_DN691_c0_g1_i2.p1 TRINITY_DN691_c0_g1~~TRINITY_DN691_c0_g1_i2.p1  ORF type:complete len:138 (-),score=22.28 TRINITY_DN691_c0_g1_i2:14-397(-)